MCHYCDIAAIVDPSYMYVTMQCSSMKVPVDLCFMRLGMLCMILTAMTL